MNIVRYVRYSHTDDYIWAITENDCSIFERREKNPKWYLVAANPELFNTTEYTEVSKKWVKLNLPLVVV